MYSILVTVALPLLALAIPTPCLPGEHETPPPEPPNPVPTTTPCTTDRDIIPVAQPGKATVLNHCAYPLNLWSITPLGSSAVHVLSPGNGIYTESLQSFPKNGGGVSLKISRTTLNAPITQFEYTSDGKEGSGELWYNTSFVNCADHVTMSAAACPGHDGGVKATSGNGCREMSCEAGEVCEANAYFLPEHGGKGNAPVGSCGGDEGLLFELCAGGEKQVC